MQAIRPGPQQRAPAQQVDAPRHAARQAVDALERRPVERQRTGVAGHVQPVLDVLRALGVGQRVQMKTRDHALGQLLELGAGQHGAQFGLADQHDLQQLALAGFQVGQQAQLLQHVGFEVLRLVDDEDATLSGGVTLQQKRVERVDVVLDRGRVRGGRRRRDVELLANRLQQFGDGELGVEDIGHMAAGGNLLQKAAADGGFAGADVAREQHKAAARAAGRLVRAGHAVQQVRQRLAVALAHEQVTRVRRDGKRVLRQAEMVRVHRAQAYPRTNRLFPGILGARPAEQASASPAHVPQVVSGCVRPCTCHSRHRPNHRPAPAAPARCRRGRG